MSYIGYMTFMITRLQRVVGGLGVSLVLAAVFASSALFGQTNAARPAVNGNRYLLIVETSGPMARRSDATLKVVQGLFASGMNGQIQKGDTLGVWTFNDELHAGVFPLQRWVSETEKGVIGRTLKFLKEQSFEHEPNLEKLMPVLARVIKGSESIVVILVSSGSKSIHGTPFDSRINQSFNLWKDQQQKAKMPIITVLRGNAGKIVDYSMTAAPWPVEIPAPKTEAQFVDLTPPAAPPAKPVAKPVATNAPAVTPSTASAASNASPSKAVAPLIFSGPNHDEAAPQKGEGPTVAEPKPVVASRTGESAPSAVVAAPKEQAANATSSSTNSTPVATVASPQLASTPPPAKRAPEPTPAKPANLVVRAKEDHPNSTEARAPQTGTSRTNEAASSKPATLLQIGSAAVPTTPVTSAIAKASAPASTPESVASKAAGTTAHVQTAVASSSQALWTRGMFWVIAVILGVASIAIVFLARGRGKTVHSASLITRSYDRK